MRKLSTTVAVIAALTLVVLAGPSSGGNGFTGVVTLSVNSGPPGTQFTVTGDNCGQGALVINTAQLRVVAHWPAPTGDQTIIGTLNSTVGIATATVTVPNGTPPGIYTLDVYCDPASDDLGALGTGQYAPSPTFTVTAVAAAPATAVAAQPATTG